MEVHPVTDTAGFRRIKLFMALSRTTHGLLDMATPALSALLWLGSFPEPPVVILGLVTAFAGYTAVYALNDVVDYRSDREKLRQGRGLRSGADLDTVFVRHPMAQGLLSLRQGLAWTVGWALLALCGAYVLHPACAAIFLGACALEAIYCALLRVSYLRTLVSGVVKTSGGLAAVLAVDPRPDPLFMVHLFLWLFLWEIGGQNVPNDWSDLEEDDGIRARTLPVQLRSGRAAWVVLICVCSSVLLGLGFRWVTRAHLHLVFQALALVAGWSLLIWPAWRLFRERSVEAAAGLFNRASYYPLAVFGSVLVAWAV